MKNDSTTTGKNICIEFERASKFSQNPFSIKTFYSVPKFAIQRQRHSYYESSSARSFYPVTPLVNLPKVRHQNQVLLLRIHLSLSLFFSLSSSFLSYALLYSTLGAEGVEKRQEEQTKDPREKKRQLCETKFTMRKGGEGERYIVNSGLCLTLLSYYSVKVTAMNVCVCISRC